MGRKPLEFRADGTFTIVQFTDLHVYGDSAHAAIIFGVMDAIVAHENPDMIVVTGDMIYAPMCQDALDAFRQAASHVDGYGIPWAFIFGNHDAEMGPSKERFMEVLQTYRNCYAESGNPDIHGVGNYVLTVNKGQRAGAALYFLDTGENADLPIGGYDWLRLDQISWYIRTSETFEAQCGDKLPALLFVHIPIPEYDSMWRTQTCYGQKNEPVACARVNSGMFAALIEQGDVHAVFAGHDHTNDYCGSLHGIKLCYGRVTGDNAGGKVKRGARVIRIYADRRMCDTWIREADGTRVVMMEDSYVETDG